MLTSQLGVPDGQVGICYYEGILKDYQAGINAPELTKGHAGLRVDW